MPSNYQAPGVDIEPAKNYPPVVKPVETAIPAFIGFTETAINLAAADLVQQPFLINNFLEYVRYFGGPPVQQMTVSLDKLNTPFGAVANIPHACKMYYAIKHYFDNGGGTCYVLSLGDYTAALTADASLYDDSNENAALSKLGMVDDITLILFPDLPLLDEAAYYEVYRKALKHCATLKDRFLIIDVCFKNADGNADTENAISNFRVNIGDEHLSYGGAYFPYLKSTYNYHFTNNSIRFKQDGGQFDGITAGDLMLLINATELQAVLSKSIKRLSLKNKTARLRLISTSLAELMQHVKAPDMFPMLVEAIFKVDEERKAKTGKLKEDTSDALLTLISLFKEKANEALKRDASHKKVKNNSADENAKYFRKVVNEMFRTTLIEAINQVYVALPPSAAVAGVYAYTDRARGVWKSPASVSLQSVLAPLAIISESEQVGMNGGSSGISINAIRAFPARGVLVWGARTLDAGSNEWRYVAVRRYCMMVEESLAKACDGFCFEPNDAATWLKIKSMTESFLLSQWKAGALTGVKPEQAFFVKIGLHETMTQADLLSGIMVLEIGMAVIRPAEFIILRIRINCLRED